MPVAELVVRTVFILATSINPVFGINVAVVFPGVAQVLQGRKGQKAHYTWKSDEKITMFYIHQH